jgi:hypothetical protein
MRWTMACDMYNLKFFIKESVSRLQQYLWSGGGQAYT